MTNGELKRNWRNIIAHAAKADIPSDEFGRLVDRACDVEVSLQCRIEAQEKLLKMAEANGWKDAWAEVRQKGMTKEIEQLAQLTSGPVWDGNLMNKDACARLHKNGLVFKTHGWNSLSEKGCVYCVELGILRSAAVQQ